MFRRPGDEPRAELLKTHILKGEFRDDSRAGRVVPFKIYYPDGAMEGGMLPAIVWSHGLGGSRDGAAFLVRFIASHGYIVINVQHAGTDSSMWEGKPGHPWDVIRKTPVTRQMSLDRFRDVPFLLDCLQGGGAPEIAGRIDWGRVGMSGHSFGAMTTQAMAGMLFPDARHTLVSLRDARIKAGILYSPTPIAHLTDAPPEEIYTPLAIPLFHMTGTEDHSPLDHHNFEDRLAIHKNAGHPEQYLKILEGGDHMIYTGSRGKLAANPGRDEQENIIKAASLAFWDAYLKGDEKAKAWLKERWS